VNVSACKDAMRIKISILSQYYSRQCAEARVQPSPNLCLTHCECTKQPLYETAARSM
jgi:hypothetical protein